MKLDSPQSGASWNLFTSLIHLPESAWQSERACLPVIEYADYRTYSDVFHELTHMWSVRSSRFGFWIGRVAAEVLLKWETHRSSPLTMNPHDEAILSAMAPLLEGLALFTELDFDLHDINDVLSNPVTLACDITSKCMMGEMSHADLFQHVRQMIRYPEDHHTSLAELLYLDTQHQSKNFYLAGYLYIKSWQSVYRQRCSQFSDSVKFLAVLTRLICDHPVFEEISEEVTPLQVLERIHTSLAGFSRDHFGILMAALSAKSNLFSRFDNWDPYGSGDLMKPVFHGTTTAQKFYPIDEHGKPRTADDKPLVDAIFRIRAAASIYLFDHVTGRLARAAENTITLITPRGDVTLTFTPLAPTLLFPKVEAEPDAEKQSQMASFAALAHHVETSLPGMLKKHIGRNVSVGQFLSVTRGTPGIAVWLDEALLDFVAYDFSVVFDAAEQFTLPTALKFSLADRAGFAAQYQNSPNWGRLVDNASDYLLRQLIGDPRRRDEIAKYRFHRTFRSVNHSLRDWCRFEPNVPKALSLQFTAALEQIFDFPGFPSDKPQAAELMPQW